MVARWNPVEDLMTMREAMDRLINESFVSPRRILGAGSAVGRMAVDLYEKDDNYVLRAYVPGVKAEDVEINADRNTISIRAHVPSEAEKEEAKNYQWLLHELGHGDVARTVELPVPIDANKIEANVEGGVLMLVMPKAEEAKPKQIKVNIK